MKLKVGDKVYIRLSYYAHAYFHPTGKVAVIIEECGTGKEPRTFSVNIENDIYCGYYAWEFEPIPNAIKFIEDIP